MNYGQKDAVRSGSEVYPTRIKFYGEKERSGLTTMTWMVFDADKINVTGHLTGNGETIVDRPEDPDVLVRYNVRRCPSLIDIGNVVHNISLSEGWNLISIPVTPEDTSISSVLYGISGNYSIVWAYDAGDAADPWKKYDPSVPFGNDLTDLNSGKCSKQFMSTDAVYESM